MVYYMVRAFLENDAMIKARYLAKEYMEKKKIKAKVSMFGRDTDVELEFNQVEALS